MRVIQRVIQIVPLAAGVVRSERRTNPFDKYIGINTEGLTSSKETCAITVVPNKTSLNIQGSVHGGWIAALLDAVASGAAYSKQPGALTDNEYGLTASLNIKFNLPLFPERQYTCEGKVISREGNNIQTEAKITDESGRQVAIAQALVKALKADR